MPEPSPLVRAALQHPPRPSGSWLAAQGRLPLAFMGLALLWLIAAAAMLVLQPEVLAFPHTAPAVVALAHAWVLGFFVTVACGAVYQLAPVALGTTLWSERRAWWHFGLHAVGVPGMVYSFAVGDLTQLGHFGTFVAIGVGLFAENTWRTIHRSNRGGAVAWSLALASGWLLLTAVAGLVLAANLFWRFIPLEPLGLLRAHAHLGLAGVFLTLLQGVSFQLVPMFTLGQVRRWPLVNAGLWLSQLGLLGLAPTLVFGANGIACVFAIMILGGAGCSGVALVDALGTRKKRALDPGTAWFLRGCVGLAAAMIAGVALMWPGSSWGSAPGGFSAMVYAVLVFGGGLLPCIAGMLCKIIPFLTWMRAYGPKVGRMQTPTAAELTHPQLEQWGLGLQAAAVVPLAVGTWCLHDTWLRVGAWMLAAGVVVFAADMVAVLMHLKPTPAKRRPDPVRNCQPLTRVPPPNQSLPN